MHVTRNKWTAGVVIRRLAAVVVGLRARQVLWTFRRIDHPRQIHLILTRNKGITQKEQCDNKQ